MRTLLMLLVAGPLLAAPKRVMLIDDEIHVDAARTYSQVVRLEQQQAVLECEFTAKDAPSGVRVALVDRSNGDTVYATEYMTQGAFRIGLKRAGEFRIDIENRKQRLGSATVAMRAALVFGEAQKQDTVRTLPEETRRRVVAWSILALVAMVGFASWKLMPAILARRTSPPPDESD
jgi:hypothetical protein